MEIDEQSQDLITQRSIIFETKVTPFPSGRSPLPQVPQKETVQPVDLFQTAPRTPEPKLVLNDVHIAPVGNNGMPKPNALDHTSPKTISFQGKATRQTPKSVADATISEVIKSVLAGPNSPDSSANSSDLDHNLPDGKASPRDIWLNDPTSSGSASSKSTSNSPTNTANSPASEEASKETQIEDKVKEVIRVLQERGYILHKDPSATPKPVNTGSVAGNKSENQVTCVRCKKFRGRPCELRCGFYLC
jgi:hypothetical protein